MFPTARLAHERNLLLVLDHMPLWERLMKAELREKRYRARHVRIHDSGDFFSDEYLLAWLRIIRATPWVTFYAYTKEVSRFRQLVEPQPPANFRWIYSFGGKQDHLIDRQRDRNADVFPTKASALAAGYPTQENSDLFAIYSPNRVGIIANNIPAFRKKQGDDTFSTLQAKRAAKGADVGLQTEKPSAGKGRSSKRGRAK